MKLVFIFLLTSFLISCSEAKSTDGVDLTQKKIDRSLLVDVSQFNIDSLALQNKEKVKIICASESLFPTDKEDYFIHTIAVSMGTGDTVNLLATGVIDVEKDNPYGQFISSNSSLALILQNMGNVKDGTNVKDLKPNKFDKVYSDPKFITIEASKFPAVIGAITKQEDAH